MTTTLVVPPAQWDALRADLLSTPALERAAVGFAGIAEGASGKRLLLRDWAPVEDGEYLVQLGYHLEVSGEIWASAAKRARGSGEAVLIFHSHPRDGHRPSFSSSDDAGEDLLIPKIQVRASVPVGSVVVSPAGWRGRVSPLGEGSRELPVQIVGELGHVSGSSKFAAGDRFDRQVRGLTREGQAALMGLRVGVVGAGGLGSHVVQQLVHLGVGEVVVIDPDRVAVSNLSRLVGATQLDARLRRAKTHVMRRLARRLASPTRVTEVRRSVMDGPAVGRLLDCDVVVGCTDNQLSRTALNTVAFQFYVPVLDLGVEIQPQGAMGGRVSWLAPGGPCLWCMGVLDAERVRVEQLPEAIADAERARGYIPGVEEPAPAVISINGVVASLAVTELLARATGFAGPGERASMLLYRLADGVVRRTSPEPSGVCPTCSAKGALGTGGLISPAWAAAATAVHDD
jgi:molybdopterin-synthase adenylyltransferase